MIQVLQCEICYETIPSYSFKQHVAKCNSKLINDHQGDEVISRISITDFDINQIRMFLKCEKLKEIVYNDVSKAIKSSYEEELRGLKFEIAAQAILLEIYLKKTTLIESIKSQMRYLVQEQINSYEGVILAIEPSYLQIIPELESKYIVQHFQQGLHLIAKKCLIVQTIIMFFNDILGWKKNNKSKIKIVSDILEFDNQRLLIVEETVHTLHLFFNLQQINIKIKKSQKSVFVFICGSQAVVADCIEHIQITVNGEINQFDSCSKMFSVSNEEWKVIEKNKVLDKYKNEFGVRFEIKPLNIVRSFPINKTSRVSLLFNSSILSFPLTSILILPPEMSKQLKQFQKTIQSFSSLVFFEPSEGMSVEESVSEFIRQYIEEKGQIGIVMPNENKDKFMQKIRSILQGCYKNIQLYVLERSQEKQSIQVFEKVMLSHKKWYAKIGSELKFYPDQTCKKMERCLSLNSPLLILTQADLQISKITHRMDTTTDELVHIKTNERFLTQRQNDQLIVLIDDMTCIVESKDIHQEGITCGVFLIDITKMTQKNMISNNEHEINYLSMNLTDLTELQCDRLEYQVIVKFPFEQEINTFWEQITKTTNSFRLQKKISMANLKRQKLGEIEDWCKIHNVSMVAPMEEEEEGNIVVSCFSQQTLNNLQKIVEIYRKNPPEQIRYPQFWEMNQKQQIYLCEVKKQSKQFQNVEAKFKIAKIKNLLRIQNQILFQKYSNERTFLSNLNNTPNIRELMLYHGTRANDPELIYGDKEESFNINYANMGSYGKGIYFARDSSYSNNYCFVRGSDKFMLYCMVLAGNSEIYNGSQKLNTNWRNAEARIRYESVVDGATQKIVVVFKNRRAYPLYLINY